MNYTITKVGLTNQTASYPAVCLYFVVQFANGVVNDFAFSGLLANIALSAWSNSRSYQVGDTCIVNDVVYACVAPCLNKTPPNATYWAVQSSNVIKDCLLRAMTGFVADMATLGYSGNMVDPHITVNPNVGGVPAAAMILNGTSGTI